MDLVFCYRFSLNTYELLCHFCFYLRGFKKLPLLKRGSLEAPACVALHRAVGGRLQMPAASRRDSSGMFEPDRCNQTAAGNNRSRGGEAGQFWVVGG